MQVFSLFNFSTSINLAISTIEEIGIPPQDIFVVPFNDEDKGNRLFDSIYAQDGIAMFDKAFALATAFSVVTASIGFKLNWGPIIWGLLGAAGGFLIGYLIDLIQAKKRKNGKRLDKKMLPAIILIINCKEQEVENIETILYENQAIGVNTPLRSKTKPT